MEKEKAWYESVSDYEIRMLKQNSVSMMALPQTHRGNFYRDILKQIEKESPKDLQVLIAGEWNNYCEYSFKYTNDTAVFRLNPKWKKSKINIEIHNVLIRQIIPGDKLVIEGVPREIAKKFPDTSEEERGSTLHHNITIKEI